MPQVLEETIRQLKSIRLALILLGRFSWLRMLTRERVSDKLPDARIGWLAFEHAYRCDEYLAHTYQEQSVRIYWSEDAKRYASSDPSGGQIDTILIDIGSRIIKWITSLQMTIEEVPVLAPIGDVVRDVSSSLPFITQNALEVLHASSFDDSARTNSCVCRTIQGPRHVAIDPAFTPTDSLMDQPAPVFGDSVELATPYFWTLAMRESMASESTALSGIEYDGLPISFYRDIAKQTWDEMRHAQMFFELAVELIPYYGASLLDSDPRKALVHQFKETRTGLPVPKERNLYEAMWNADLPERLVIMQIKTEGPAVAAIRKKLKTKLCVVYPKIRLAFQVDEQDERSHAAIGARWLKYLIPDSTDRAELMAQAELLRGVLLLTSFSHYNSISLPELVYKYSTGKVMPVAN
jgi:hypothetical protein